MKSLHLVPAFALLPLAAFAEGIRLNDHDAKSTARGNAFVATSDNPSAIFYNPAGITQLAGQQFSTGAYALTYQTTFRSPVGKETESKRAYEAVPHFFYTLQRAEWPSLTFGFATYSPFGLSMKWPETTGFRSVATEGRIQTMTAQPVVAIQLMGRGPSSVGGTAPFEPSLSLGFGPTATLARADLAQGLSPFAGNDAFHFKGDDWAYGFSAGLRWQPVREHAFGITYHSPMSADFSGHTDTSAIVPAFAITQPASAKFKFPQIVAFGWSWRPIAEWNVELNANWTDWSSFDRVPIRQATPVPPLTLNWHPSWYYSAGATRTLDNGWRVSGGYIYVENSVPDASYTPLVPDTNRHAWSVGVGRDAGVWTWDIAYQLTRGLPRQVRGNAITGAGESADGRYDWWSHAINIDFGRKF